MKINIGQPLKDFKGDFLKDSSGQPWPLSDALIQACQASVQGDNPSGDEKFKRWKLAQKIAMAQPEELADGSQTVDCVADLSIDELAMLKKLSGQCFSAVVVGPIWTILEAK